MAQIVSVELTDDLDDSPADETLRFSLDGREYEIDLSEKNVRKFRADIGPYLAHARHAPSGGRKSRGNSTNTRDRKRSADIRAWAAETGRAISARGRIPRDVEADYDQEFSGAEFSGNPVTVTPRGPAAQRAGQSGQAVGHTRGRTSARGNDAAAGRGISRGGSQGRTGARKPRGS